MRHVYKCYALFSLVGLVTRLCLWTALLWRLFLTTWPCRRSKNQANMWIWYVPLPRYVVLVSVVVNLDYRELDASKAVYGPQPRTRALWTENIEVRTGLVCRLLMCVLCTLRLLMCEQAIVVLSLVARACVASVALGNAWLDLGSCSVCATSCMHYTQ